MPEFGRKKYGKLFAELESRGIVTDGITDHRHLYVALARLKGLDVVPGALPSHEDAATALWFYKFRGEVRPVVCIVERAAPDVRRPAEPSPPPPSHRIAKRNMCDGKVAHRSAAAAQKAIDNSDYDKEFLNAYRCLYCGKYHVGHVIKPWVENRTTRRQTT